jgi:glycerol-3-phosphate acyltransferase PlsX
VVADGFTGNVIIKTIEGTASMILSQLKEKFTRDLRSKLGSLALLPALREVKRSLDYEEYGGALLLGVNGVVIVGHGSSRAKAVRNSIKVAVEMVQEKTVEKIAKEMEREVR